MSDTVAPPTATDHGTAWLTRVRMSPTDRAVQRDLRDAAALHRRVMSLLPDGLGTRARSEAGVLFRVETEGTGSPELLVQSRLEPDLSKLPAGYSGAQVKSMSAMLAALRPGLTVRYRILGNAVRRCGRNSTEGRWKEVIPLHGEDAERWWAAKADAAGLAVLHNRSDPAEALTAWHQAPESDADRQPTGATEKDGKRTKHVRVPHQPAKFEGTALVRDPELLRAAVLNGVGRGKSYGCGLLSLAPGGAGV
ncbi:type I-E CRISPR-associated protein Cas6/Cse3/CasE [Streptomyces bohaiensis]|uniref:Type I-E CRISPR-associated protein Cas6/Cse3/CasE n=1 Tax=Streptomyces bohaiensis TaxID=1431344 RepID=A0ABX1C854_9ACTN|nr:type I-E CRISPR-associated protein Cas6/Cse3/CasE [Streptomyces bohaiensis]NJQ14411.1 type I-E CRISPR-associated protein Cas6/Cse3/CasE [Streptomyces bohaiensis]